MLKYVRPLRKVCEKAPRDADSAARQDRCPYVRRGTRHVVRGVEPARAGSTGTWTGFDGFMTHRILRKGPKEMRISPLRSAVQMGSDVSPGSSVTLGRSEVAER